MVRQMLKSKFLIIIEHLWVELTWARPNVQQSCLTSSRHLHIYFMPSKNNNSFQDYNSTA